MNARAASALLALALLAGAAGIACSGGGEPDGAAEATAASGAGGAIAAGEAGLASGYPRFVDDGTGLTVVLGTPDLGVGRQRVSFVLSDAGGIVRLPIATLAARFGANGESRSAIARFHEFPGGVRGLHVGWLDFDRAGEWTLEVSVPRPDGSIAATSFPVAVAGRTRAPGVGDPAPASRNRTLADAESVHDLSTGADPDPALYERTIAGALAEGRPLAVVFASPGFCTNALCGPQAEVLSALRARYADRARFIHVDLYENPAEVRRAGLEAAVETPLLAEWGLETAEWTFIVDAEGRVAARFEAFATEDELEQALLAVLGGA